jgi:hypothetical protein
MFESVLSLIKAHSRIILHRHQNPDGDALGAQIGLYHILKENFPEKDILTVGDMNRRYAFITEGKEMNTVEDGAYKDALISEIADALKEVNASGKNATAKETSLTSSLSNIFGDRGISVSSSFMKYAARRMIKELPGQNVDVNDITRLLEKYAVSAG